MSVFLSLVSGEQVARLRPADVRDSSDKASPFRRFRSRWLCYRRLDLRDARSETCLSTSLYRDGEPDNLA
jgi:hypothetical protein